MPSLPNRHERQEPPFAVQIELTEWCNLRCSFCGLNGIRERAPNNFKFMTPAVASRVATHLRQAQWTSRIEFAMHGEPSMNPDMLHILELFRTALPRNQLMMTSNGGGFMKDPNTFVNLALSHLNILALDWYENVNIVPKVLERYTGPHVVRRYPQDPEANPHRRIGYKDRMFVVIQDISKAEKGTHASLNNHCGAGAPRNNNGMGKRCAKPFRELSVRWDGTVAVCCNDWRGEYVCGDLKTQTLEEIWNGAAFRAARRKLMLGQRDFGACKGCDATSYRVGLLPDKKGKVRLPAPTVEDQLAIERAVAAGPLTPPVLRPWELVELGTGKVGG